MLQNAPFNISLPSCVIKFHLPTDGTNATGQLLREKAAWRGKESVPVSSEAFSLVLRCNTNVSQSENTGIPKDSMEMTGGNS